MEKETNPSQRYSSTSVTNGLNKLQHYRQEVNTLYASKELGQLALTAKPIISSVKQLFLTGKFIKRDSATSIRHACQTGNVSLLRDILDLTATLHEHINQQDDDENTALDYTVDSKKKRKPL